MQVFRAQVVRVTDVSPSLRRIVFGGEGLAGFRSTGVGDEYLRIMVPAAGKSEPVLPKVVDGALDYGSTDLGLLRTYTVRDVDPRAGEVSIDFVLHAHGVVTGWARVAAPGDVVGMNSPTSLYSPPEGLTWQILLADDAGLPALARLLELTPAGVRSRVIVEVPDESHRIPLAGGADVTWLSGGNGATASHLEEALRSLPRPSGGVGYTWVAGESRTLRGIRRHLRHELGLAATQYKVVGYWTDHAEEWRARYEALDDATRRSLDALWASDRDEAEIEEEYDRRLVELGL